MLYSIFDPRSIESAKNTVASFMKTAFAQSNVPTTTAIICSAVVGLFAYEQYVYLKKKKSLPGPSFKIPIIGAFTDSLYPTFEGYMSKWKSGELSCVSVFDRYDERNPSFFFIVCKLRKTRKDSCLLLLLFVSYRYGFVCACVYLYLTTHTLFSYLSFKKKCGGSSDVSQFNLRLLNFSFFVIDLLSLLPPVN